MSESGHSKYEKIHNLSIVPAQPMKTFQEGRGFKIKTSTRTKLPQVPVAGKENSQHTYKYRIQNTETHNHKITYVFVWRLDLMILMRAYPLLGPLEGMVLEMDFPASKSLRPAPLIVQTFKTHRFFRSSSTSRPQCIPVQYILPKRVAVADPHVLESVLKTRDDVLLVVQPHQPQLERQHLQTLDKKFTVQFFKYAWVGERKRGV